MPGRTDVALASMGIYVFSAAFLYEQLIKDAGSSTSSHDFGKDILPNIIKSYRIMAYPFRNPEQGTSLLARTSARGCLLGGEHGAHRL